MQEALDEGQALSELYTCQKGIHTCTGLLAEQPFFGQPRCLSQETVIEASKHGSRRYIERTYHLVPAQAVRSHRRDEFA